MKISGEMALRARNDHLLNMAYNHGEQCGLDELETLKKFVLLLLDLKDDIFQKEVDKLMTSTAPLFSHTPENMGGKE